MKSTIALVIICGGLLLGIQSCLTCTKCSGPLKEAICIKPNDTIEFNARATTVHRHYNGGDSSFYFGYQGFDYAIQLFTDSGYTCTTYYIDVAEVKGCNQAGESDDDEYKSIRGYYGYQGYTCIEYKGH